MIYFDNASSKLYNHDKYINFCIDISSDFNVNRLFSNPHSMNITSSESTKKIIICRKKILDYVNADENIYDCIFTSSTTESFKIIGESFKWDNNSLIYTVDNHTSAIGMREYALKYGSSIKVIDFDNNKNIIEVNSISSGNKLEKKNNINLCVIPAESNFSGKLYNRELIFKIRQKYGNTIFFYDVAKYITSNKVSLKDNIVDITAISFYKIYGFPTGLGCMIIKKDISKYLNKVYYGGGSILSYNSYENHHVKNDILYKNFEYGSPNYLSIIYLNKLLDKTIDYEKIHNLTYFFYNKVRNISYNNSKIKFFELYDIDLNYDYQSFCKNHGSIISFNLLKSTGDYIGYKDVEKFCNEKNIALRTGTLCNNGAFIKNLKISSDLRKKIFNENIRLCNTTIQFIKSTITGVVRVSFSEDNNIQEVMNFINLIKTKFYI